VFEGNVGDPSTVPNQVDKLKQRFRLERVVLIGDRGMITQARIEQTVKPAGLNFITALRAPAIRILAEAGTIQLSLFDQRDLAEITSPRLSRRAPGRLSQPAACRRARAQRRDLAQRHRTGTAHIQARVRRHKRPLRGMDKIALAVGAVINHYKMAKHFDVAITDTDLSFRAQDRADPTLRPCSTASTCYAPDLGSKALDATSTVRAYKDLARGRRAMMDGPDFEIDSLEAAKARSTFARSLIGPDGGGGVEGLGPEVGA